MENWKHINLETKLVASFWLYQDICNELQIYPPKFLFTENGVFRGFYIREKNLFNINLKVLDKTSDNKTVSAYDLIDTICHELNKR